MILSQQEVALLKPVFALLEYMKDSTVTIVINAPGVRKATVSVDAAGIYILAEYPNTLPAKEFYRKAEGLALGYGLPVTKLVSPTRSSV